MFREALWSRIMNVIPDSRDEIQTTTVLGRNLLAGHH
jgi:hypothetical protein